MYLAPQWKTVDQRSSSANEVRDSAQGDSPEDGARTHDRKDGACRGLTEAAVVLKSRGQKRQDQQVTESVDEITPGDGFPSVEGPQHREAPKTSGWLCLTAALA